MKNQPNKTQALTQLKLLKFKTKSKLPTYLVRDGHLKCSLKSVGLAQVANTVLKHSDPAKHTVLDLAIFKPLC